MDLETLTSNSTSRLVQLFLQSSQCDQQTDTQTQTDHATPYAAMLPNNNDNDNNNLIYIAHSAGTAES